MRLLSVVLVCALATAGTALAQGARPAPPQGQQQERPDTVEVPQFRVPPPVAPLGAMWRSLLLPGWGQSLLDRRATGAAFIFWEGVALTMTVKSLQQLRYQERVNAATVEDKRDELQDWAVLLGFNHLLAAAEAFVAAQLWDFPGELEARGLPGGQVRAGLRVGF